MKVSIVHIPIEIEQKVSDFSKEVMIWFFVLFKVKLGKAFSIFICPSTSFLSSEPSCVRFLVIVDFCILCSKCILVFSLNENFFGGIVSWIPSWVYDIQLFVYVLYLDENLFEQGSSTPTLVITLEWGVRNNGLEFLLSVSAINSLLSVDIW